MSTTATPPLDPGAVSRLLAGSHDDPFSVLGPHRHGEQTWVTALDPGAEEMAAVVGRKEFPLGRVEGGLFSGEVPAGKPYRLRGRGGGRQWEYDDAYRFGPVLSDLDEYLLGEGTHQRLWEALGAHPRTLDGVAGTHFAVWAPNARRVSVVGDFNAWDGRRHVMRRRGATGVWEIFVPGPREGASYKYEVIGPHGERLPLKADPVGFGSQHPPETASVVRDIAGYGWSDQDWMEGRALRHRRDAPMSIYEVHLGSWKRIWNQGGRPLSYKEAARELVGYARDMGFTHLEFLPLSEYPFDGSWGYQPIGLFAPSIRFGPPHEFRDLVGAAHEAGLGVLLDWVPGHFPTDAHGLARFDGTALYEHQDPREGFHQDWNTLIYNFGRSEVANFLVANALYWLEEYHVDGLRVDAVASMLYRDYSRRSGEWIPNAQGGRENFEAIALLRRMNATAYGRHPGILTVAEESTAFPGVSAPVDAGGLGFGYKWNMGWMNDTLRYMQQDPIHRKWHHHLMTFGLHYAFSENFVLPISHDEVVHGKGSLTGKMPGDYWQKLANTRALLGFMWAFAGKQLVFMGAEMGGDGEWNEGAGLDWSLLDHHPRKGLQTLVRDLNTQYRNTPALWTQDTEPSGFRWITSEDSWHNTFSFIRMAPNGDPLVCVVNFASVPHENYRIGLPRTGTWREVVNTDAEIYGGSGVGNMGSVQAEGLPWHGLPASAELRVPPLGALWLRPEA